MIGYHRTLLSVLPVLERGFDTVNDHDSYYGTQIKAPSLEDYDHDGIDEADADIRLCLDRWGDMRVPEHRC
jgi:hypothetical protein